MRVQSEHANRKSLLYFTNFQEAPPLVDWFCVNFAAMVHLADIISCD